jgi:DNA-binding response OmpR family regulator
VCIISDRLRFVHPRYSHRILYAGHNLALLKFLQDELEDCQIVRCSDDSTTRLLISSAINYSLFLFDEVLPDTRGEALCSFVGELAHREQTPIVIVKKSDEFEAMARAITHLLSR